MSSRSSDSPGWTPEYLSLTPCERVRLFSLLWDIFNFGKRGNKPEPSPSVLQKKAHMSHSLKKCSASKDPKMTHYIKISASFHARNHFVRAGVHCVEMLNKLIKNTSRLVFTRRYTCLNRSAPGIETGDTLLSLLNTEVMLSKPQCFSSISRTFKEPR